MSLSGSLDHSSVPALLKEIKPQQFTSVDLQAVTHSNCAGIALLLELKQLAGNRDRALTITNVPEQMRRVAELSGVAELL